MSTEQVLIGIDGQQGLHYVNGDATQPLILRHPVIIAHIVNDAGAWGAGFVKALSKRSRVPEEHYRRWHSGSDPYHHEVRTGPLTLGNVQVVTACIPPVASLCAQHGIRSTHPQGAGRVKAAVPPIRYDALRQCLDRLEIILAGFDEGRKTRYQVHMPRIGSGLAGGNWGIIEGIIKAVFHHRCVVVYDLPARK